MNKTMFSAHILTLAATFLISFFLRGIYHMPQQLNDASSSAVFATPEASPSASPTPRPLTFAEMNEKYGPCAYLPTLMYHHVQDLKTAEEQGHKALTVGPEFFRAHLQYLRDSGYSVITIHQLIAFFDQASPLPNKPLLLTFDDGYDDFGTTAAPILREFGYPAVVFIPTGLIENAGYMNWNTVIDLNNANLYMANHSWSHQNISGAGEVVDHELSTAQTQLSNHGLDTSKVFAYPYGLFDQYAQNYLATHGYSVAFTTQPGSIACKQQRFALPRIRIGNGGLGGYGL